MIQAEAEVLVVGGGPAGLAAAIAVRRAGLAVRLLDAATPPVDKPCGEGLMPDALASLEVLGVQLDAAAGVPFRGIRYVDGELAAEGRFPGRPGLGVRRTTLHQALVRRALEAGVELEWGTRVLGLAPGGDGVATAAGERRARWLVAADGLRSPLRHAAGLASRPARRRRFGARRHFAVAPWSDLVEVHWVPNVEAYVTPVGPREVGVALLWSGERAGFDDLLARFPALVDRLAGAAVSSRLRGTGPLEQRVRGVHRGRLALVGDAAGYLDAITGEGLAIAFHQALALAPALAAGDLGPYARACRRIVALPALVTRLLLLAEARPALRRRLIRTLSRDPALFSRLLAIHARALPPASLGLGGALRLVRGLVS